MTKIKSLQEYLREIIISEEDVERISKKNPRKNSKYKEVIGKLETTELKDISGDKDSSKDVEICAIINEYHSSIYKSKLFYQKRKITFDNSRYFYRGVSKAKYKLVSGLYRLDEKHNENYYFHELHIRCPEILSKLTYFNKLTYMQHYGAPTRLLDITANPLVGLYFACQNHSEYDGKVFIFCVNSSDVTYENSNKITILSHLQDLTDKKQEKVRFWSYAQIIKGDNSFPRTQNSKYKCKEIERLFYNIKKENNSFEREMMPFDLLQPVFVQPNQDNPRLLKQDGAFIMSGLDYDENDSHDKISNYVIKEIIIPKECKKDILKELDRICIHQASLFPELDTVAEYLKKK